MLTGTVTPDGYYVGADGAWIPDNMNLSGFIGEVLLYMSAANRHTGSITGNTWRVAGEWSRLEVDDGANFFSIQELNVNENTRYFRVEEGSGVKTPISRESFERNLIDRSLGYEGFELELNNRTVIKAYVFD